MNFFICGPLLFLRSVFFCMVILSCVFHLRLIAQENEDTLFLKPIPHEEILENIEESAEDSEQLPEGEEVEVLSEVPNDDPGEEVIENIEESAEDSEQLPEGEEVEVLSEVPNDDNVILVDDFDKGETEGVYYKRKNSLGYYQGTWTKRPSYTSITKSEVHRIGEKGKGLVIAYKKEGGWCGWYTILGDLNVEEMNILSFWIKGDIGGERFKVGFKDKERYDLEMDGVYAGPVTQFIGEITTEWKEVKIPLSRVGTSLNLSELSAIVFEFSFGGEGIIYLENMKFKVDPDISRIEEENLPKASKSTHPRSMWVWKIDPVLNEKARFQLLKFCERAAIEIIYVFFGDFDPDKNPEYTKMLEEFLVQSHDQGVEVEVLTGNPTWALEENHHKAYKWLKPFLDFNKSRPKSMRISGVSFDVEPYLAAEWKTEKERVKEEYLLLMKGLRELIDSYPDQDFRFGGAIPTFYINEDGFEESILKLVDYAALMDYFDTAESILENGILHLELAKKLGKQIWLGVEIQDLVTMKQGFNINTFYEEGWSFMEQELGKVYKEVDSSPGFGGLAMHCYYAYRDMNKEGRTPENSIRLEKPKRDFRDPEFKKGDIYTLYSFRTARPIHIDGRLDDWDLAYPFDLAKKRQVVYGSGAWKGKEDYSCKVYNAWDENHLYIAFDITDDTLSQWRTGKDMWEGDHVELWLDTDLGGDFIEAVNSKDDFQIGLNPGNGDDIAPEFYIWTPALKNKGELPIQVASKKTTTGYIIEVSIAKEALYGSATSPMSVVDIIESEKKDTSRRVRYTRKKKGKPPESFYQGYQMGIMADASDTDRRGTSQKCLLSTSLDRKWGDPTVFGFLELRGTVNEEKESNFFDKYSLQSADSKSDIIVEKSPTSPGKKNTDGEEDIFVKIADIPKLNFAGNQYIYDLLSQEDQEKSSRIYRGKLGSYQLGSSAAKTIYDDEEFFHPSEGIDSNRVENLFEDIDQKSIRIIYDKKGIDDPKKKEKEFCGSYIILLGDISQYKTLCFLVRGLDGGEIFEIGINDAISHKREDAVYVGPITRYLHDGITTDWQLVSVPLEDFYGADLKMIFSLSFLFHEEAQGVIWIDELSLTKKKLVDREKEIQKDGFFVLDNFDHSDLNLLGNKSSVYINLPSSIRKSRVLIPRDGDDGRSLKLDYTRASTGWTGAYTLLNKIDGKYYDLSGFDRVSFWVKGEQGKEDFEIGLSDKNWMIIGDSLKAGQITKYLPNGVTTNWQQVVIPLKDFGPLDLSEMGSFVINFNITGEGIVYLENLTFHLTGRDDFFSESSSE